MRQVEKLHENMWINYEEVMYWAGLGWDEDWSEERKDQTAREGIKRLYNAASFGDVEGREDGVVILEVYSEKYTPAFDLICDEFNNVWDKSGLDREDLVAEKFIKKYPEMFADYTTEEVTEMVYSVLVRRYGKPKFNLYN